MPANGNGNGWKRFAIAVLLLVLGMLAGQFVDIFRSSISLAEQLSAVKISLESLDKTLKDLDKSVSAGATQRAQIAERLEGLDKRLSDKLERLERKID
jgi:septal ring factor EnvC (AmiA/AmiB activator)